MPANSNNKKPFAQTIGHNISRLGVIVGLLALVSIFGIVGMVAYKKIPVEIWGLKIGYQTEKNLSNDFPFLVTEVKQLKEQRQLLEKRLIKLIKENEVHKNELKECRNQIPLNSKG